MERPAAEVEKVNMADLVDEFARAAISEAGSGEANKMLGQIRSQLYNRLNTTTVSEEKVQLIEMAGTLVDVLNAENASAMVPVLANVLRTALTDTASFDVLRAASSLLGRLASKRGFLVISETVSFELKRALEWLPDSYEFRRLASVLVLSELALAAPAALYQQMDRYLASMWTALCDVQRPIFQAAATTLHRMLEIVLQRGTAPQALRVFSRVLDEALSGLSKNATTHGALLAIGELFGLEAATTEPGVQGLLVSKFPLICEAVLKLRASKDRRVSKTVLKLMPRLARSNPPHFATHVPKVVKHLIGLMKKPSPMTHLALSVIGDVSVAVGAPTILPHLASFVQVIVPLIRVDTRQGKSFLPYPGALLTVGQLAEAGGETMAALIERENLLERMFECGLFPELVQAATRIVSVCPPHIAEHAERYLLHVLCLVVCDAPFRPIGVPKAEEVPSFAKRIRAQVTEQGTALKIMALSTLCAFPFRGPLVHLAEKVLRYLDSKSVALKLEALSSALHLLLTDTEGTVPKLTAGVSLRVVARVLLLGTTDPDPLVRLSCMSKLAEANRFDAYISHPDNLKLLLLLCYDERMEIRTLAIRVLGNLQHVTPGFVRPAMRKMLVEHLRALELTTSPVADQAQPAIVMASFVRAAPSDLVRPFVGRLLQSVESRMNHTDHRLATAMLTVLGELAESLGTTISVQLELLLPVLVEMTQRQTAASTRREVVYRTLGKICQGGGFVSDPFVRYPTILTTLLQVVRSDPDKGVREEVLRLIGIVGALDPELYNEKQQETSKRETKADFSEVPFTSSNFSPEFYSRVAINALTGILKHSQAAILQKTVVQALVTIFRSLGARKTISYLREVIPLLLGLLRSGDAGVTDFILQELGAFVSQTGLYMGPFVDEIFALLFPRWSTPSFPLAVVLIQQIAAAFGDEFTRYVPALFPKLFAVLRDDQALPSHRQAVLSLFVSFKFCLPPYTHFIAPTLAELVMVPEMARPAMRAIISFLESLDLSLYLPSLVRALVSVLHNDEVQDLVIDVLTAMGERSGHDFAPMVPLVEDALRAEGLNAPDYHVAIARAVSRTVHVPELNSSLGGLLGAAASPMMHDSSNASRAGDDSTMGRSPDEPQAGGNNGNNNNNAVGSSREQDFGGGQEDDGGGIPSNQLSARSLDSSASLSLNIRNLSTVWSISQVSTPQDWFEWLRRFVVTLLVESPSPAFRACLSVAQIHYPLARQLFNVAFASVWRELPQAGKQKLVEALQKALNSPTIPPEILQTLLDLVEYMETEDALPIDKVSLQNLALSSAAYAKALRYAEENYRSNPEANVERMISLYTQLRIPSAAIGVLGQARGRFKIELDESWMERLQRWDTALEMYEDKARADPTALEPVMGRLRCLKALGEWELLSRAADEAWERGSAEVRVKVAPFAAGAAHNIRDWKLFDKYLHAIPPMDEDGNFYRAISCLARGSYGEARNFIVEARKQADVEMTALVAESYMRAYSAAVRLQQLVELEEIISVRVSEGQAAPGEAAALRAAVAQRWTKRFTSMAKQPDFMRRVLGVRALMLSPAEQTSSWLLYASVCARSNRMRSSRRAVAQLLGRGFDSVLELETLVPEGMEAVKARPFVGAYKFAWRSGKRQEAIAGLEGLLRKISSSRKSGSATDASLSKMYLRLASWQRALVPGNLDETALRKVADSCRMAIHYDTTYKSWHLWSLTNFETIQYYERYGCDKVRPYLQPAIQGFFQAIALAQSATLCFPDVLRVLTLWFRHAALPEVEESLREGFRKVPLDTWIVVIPQLLARIHSPVTVVRRLVHDLLVQLAELHPQALVYPLAVASKSQIAVRRTAALGVLARMKLHSPRLVEQALMVGQELIGASVVLHEQWYEGLEDAAGFYYTSENIPAMLKRLAPLHQDLLQCSFETRHQVSFQQEFGADLQEAYGLCENYKNTRDIVDLNDAWECYARVYYKLKKRIPKLRKLQLEHVSPLLSNARDMELAVPGTYAPNAPIIRIASFQNQLRVYNTKQRPRKLVVVGSDGNQYVYILKAHEDLRQDERVMQFFSLANSLLSKRIETKALNIETYPIIPLSPNSGLIGFVPHSDTIHQLISDYRVSANIPLDIEFQLLFQHVEKSWSNYHLLTTLQKVHVFRHICERTSGQELAKVMWIRAGSSERWLDNRAIFTNSFAVMSIVGYILGLGDRHPNNIVIDRVTGKLIHIDFGDCFVANTPITLDCGLSRRIADFARDGGAHVWALSSCDSAEDGTGVARQSRMLVRGEREVRSLLFADGREVECTAEHRFMTRDKGWVKAEELQPGQLVMCGLQGSVDEIGQDEKGFALAAGEFRFSTESAAERDRLLAFARVSGYMLADGSISAQSDEACAYFGHAIDVASFVHDLETVLAGVNYRQDSAEGLFVIHLPAVWRRALLEVGYAQQGRKIEQSTMLPGFVTDSDCPAAVVREFLAALFGADGWAPQLVDEGEKTAVRSVQLMQHTENNHCTALMTWVKLLLHRLGVGAVVEARINALPSGNGLGMKGATTELCLTVANGTAFADKVGFRHCARKAVRLSVVTSYWRYKEALLKQYSSLTMSAVGIFQQGGCTHKGAVGAAVAQFKSPLLTEGVPHLDMVSRRINEPNKRVKTCELGKSARQFIEDMDAMWMFDGDDCALRDESSIRSFFIPFVGAHSESRTVPTFDLTVPGVTSFCANGLVAHNCFETSIDRKKFPETVPFRCTRMLINCLEVAGVDGTFRVVCELVMEVLRANRDSLMAVMEAFVHDPLFNWKLTASPASVPGAAAGATAGAAGGGDAAAAAPPATATRGRASSVVPLPERGGADGDAGLKLYHGLSPASPLSSGSYNSSPDGRTPEENSVVGSRASNSAAARTTGTPEDGNGGNNNNDNNNGNGAHNVSGTAPNNRAMEVIDRIQKKLIGQDFGAEILDSKSQVSRLIEEATSETNLALLFHGFCPWW